MKRMKTLFFAVTLAFLVPAVLAGPGCEKSKSSCDKTAKAKTECSSKASVTTASMTNKAECDSKAVKASSCSAKASTKECASKASSCSSKAKTTTASNTKACSEKACCKAGATKTADAKCCKGDKVVVEKKASEADKAKS